MAKRIEIEQHLSLKEIEGRERSASTATARTHWQVIRLIGHGRTSKDVADITGYTAGWVRELVRRYNTHGPASLGDQRQHNSGAHQRLLSTEQEETLREKVEHGIQSGEIWTGVDVAREISAVVGYKVHRARGWELMKRWGLQLRVPRPQHAKADPEMQDIFKKNAS